MFSPQPMKKSYYFLVLSLALFAGGIGFIIARNIPVPVSQQTTYTEPKENCPTNELRLGNAGGYKFINPLLECDSYQPSQLTSVASLQKRLSDSVQQFVKLGMADTVAVYYRDLNFGPWIGVNEQAKFLPADMLSVPVAIAVFKKAENNAGFLNKQVKYVVNEGVDQGDSAALSNGSQYTILQITEQMVSHNNDAAKDALEKELGDDFIAQVMKDIGVNTTTGMAVSAKDYSGFFRLLYNATYLSRSNSELLLAMLHRNKYNQGIGAGFPTEIALANMHSEHSLGKRVMVHECGVVFVPHSAYLLCVMSIGKDKAQLSTIVKQLSSLVYTETTSPTQ